MYKSIKDIFLIAAFGFYGSYSFAQQGDLDIYLFNFALATDSGSLSLSPVNYDPDNPDVFCGMPSYEAPNGSCINSDGSSVFPPVVGNQGEWSYIFAILMEGFKAPQMDMTVSYSPNNDENSETENMLYSASESSTLPVISCATTGYVATDCPLNLRLTAVPTSTLQPGTKESCSAAFQGASLPGFVSGGYPNDPRLMPTMGVINANSCGILQWVESAKLKNIFCPFLSTDSNGNLVWSNPNDQLHWQVLLSKNVPNLIPYLNAEFYAPGAQTSVTSSNIQDSLYMQLNAFPQSTAVSSDDNTPYFQCNYYQNEQDATNHQNPVATLSYVGDQYEVNNTPAVPSRPYNTYNKPINESWAVSNYTTDSWSGPVAYTTYAAAQGIVTDCDDPSAATCCTATDSQDPLSRCGDYPDKISYVVSASQNAVEQCAVSSENGLLHGCTSLANSAIDQPISITSWNNNLYVLNWDGPLVHCDTNSINLSKNTLTCSAVSVFSSFVASSKLYQADATHAFIYAFEPIVSQLIVVSVNPNGTVGQPTNVPVTTYINGNAYDFANGYAYLPSADATELQYCVVNGSTGLLSHCQPTGPSLSTMPGAGSVVFSLSVYNNYLYIEDSSDKLRCPINSDGSVSNTCTQLSANVSGNLRATENGLYFIDETAGLSFCPYQEDNLGSCETANNTSGISEITFPYDNYSTELPSSSEKKHD